MRCEHLLRPEFKSTCWLLLIKGYREGKSIVTQQMQKPVFISRWARVFLIVGGIKKGTVPTLLGRERHAGSVFLRISQSLCPCRQIHIALTASDSFLSVLHVTVYLILMLNS